MAQPVAKNIPYRDVLLGPMVHATESHKTGSSFVHAANLAKKLERALTKDEITGETTLQLGYSSISSESMSVVLRHCKYKNIQGLDLRANGINPDTLVIIAHSLQHDRIGLKKLGMKLNVV